MNQKDAVLVIPFLLLTRNWLPTFIFSWLDFLDADSLFVTILLGFQVKGFLFDKKCECQKDLIETTYGEIV
jgi:hypothetical protein